MRRLVFLSVATVMSLGLGHSAAMAQCGGAADGCGMAACGDAACGDVLGCCDTACCPSSPLYFKAFAGGNWLDDITSTGAVQVDETWEGGALLGAGIGYELATGQDRIEFEYAYRNNAVDTLLLNGTPQNPRGDIRSHAYMFNYLHDFDTGGRLTPYVGAGIGIVEVDQDVAYGPVVIDDSSAAFGYQFMAGASYQVTSAVDLFLEYRYLGTSDVETVRTTPAATQVLDSEYDAHSLVLGAMIKFGSK